MHFPIPHRNFLTSIGIAVLTQVWAGIVFTNVLAYDAAAELALAFVLVVFLLDGVVAFI